MAALMHSVLVLFVFSVISSASENDSCMFTAAVFQHPYVDRGQDAVTALTENLDVYESKVAIAASKGAQIIVFPEDGITGLNFNSSNDLFYQRLSSDSNWNPCVDGLGSNYSLVPYRLSCMARNNGIYVVANFPTVVTDGNGTNYHYNTDAAFDNDGRLITRYYKINLYGEPEFDSPPDNVAYFDTSFGRFGLLTCFDILWAKPILQLVEQYQVDSLLFPTAWMDQLPYLTSIQSQSAIAYGFNVNLLAANQFFPIEGFLGSGLYAGQNGPVIYTYDASESNGTLLVANLPCTNRKGINRKLPDIVKQSQMGDAFHFIKHENMIEFVGTALDQMEESTQLCQGSMCCNVSYKYAEKSNVTSGGYWLVVHQGNISESDLYTYSAEVCSVLWCQDGARSLDTCAVLPITTTSVFSYINLSSNFTTPYIFPSVLTSDLQLMSNSQWSSNVQKQHPLPTFYSQLNLTISAQPLVVSLYARKYQLDPPQ